MPDATRARGPATACPHERLLGRPLGHFIFSPTRFKEDHIQEHLSEGFRANLGSEEEAQLTVKLSWMKLLNFELRVEVLARVPADYKRPYHLVRIQVGPWDIFTLLS